MRKKFLALVLTAVFCVSAFAGCSSVFEEDSEKASETASEATDKATDETAASSDVTGAAEATEKVIKYSITNEPPTLDPQLLNSMYGATLDYHLFEGLMRSNSGTIEPGCAESYEMSDDGLTYTFHLRDGLVWSDGQPLTADDFVYGMQRMVDPATASPSSFMGTILKNASKIMSGELTVDQLGVVALDESTIQITLENPAGYFLGVLSTGGYYPCRKDLVEKYGKDFAADADKNVYNGPFVLSNWEHASTLTFTKNENYWNKDVVKLSEVEISVVTDSTTALGLYETGDIDFAEIPAELVANYQDAQSFYTGSVEFLQINVTANETLANKNFRNALSCAIDREAFTKLATAGVNQATTRYVLPQVAGVEKTYGEEYPLEAFKTTADVEKAQEYLAAAMSELGITDASTIKIKFNCNGDNALAVKKAEVIQELLQSNLGIVVEINQVPYKQLYELHSAHDYEMMFTGWTPDYSDAFSYLEFFETDNGYNNSVYSNPDYDKYIQQAKSLTDPKARMDALFEAEKVLMSDLPIIPLDMVQSFYLLNDKITGFTPYFVGTNLNYISADITE